MFLFFWCLFFVLWSWSYIRSTIFCKWYDVSLFFFPFSDYVSNSCHSCQKLTSFFLLSFELILSLWLISMTCYFSPFLPFLFAFKKKFHLVPIDYVEIIDGKVTLCRYAVQNRCTRQRCKFYHPPPASSALAAMVSPAVQLSSLPPQGISSIWQQNCSKDVTSQKDVDPSSSLMSMFWREGVIFL